MLGWPEARRAFGASRELSCLPNFLFSGAVIERIHFILKKLFCAFTATVFIFNGTTVEASGKPKSQCQGQQQMVSIRRSSGHSTSKRCKPAPLKRSPFMRFHARNPSVK